MANKDYSAPWYGDEPPRAKNVKSYAAKRNASKKRDTEEEMAKGAKKYFADKAAAKKAAIDKIAKSKKMGK